MSYGDLTVHIWGQVSNSDPFRICSQNQIVSKGDQVAFKIAINNLDVANSIIPRLQRDNT